MVALKEANLRYDHVYPQGGYLMDFYVHPNIIVLIRKSDETPARAMKMLNSAETAKLHGMYPVFVNEDEIFADNRSVVKLFITMRKALGTQVPNIEWVG